MSTQKFSRLRKAGFCCDAFNRFILSDERETDQLYENSLATKRDLFMGAMGVFIRHQGNDQVSVLLAAIKDGKVLLFNDRIFDSPPQMGPFFSHVEKRLSREFYKTARDLICSKDLLDWLNLNGHRYNKGDHLYINDFSITHLLNFPGVWKNPDAICDLPEDDPHTPSISFSNGELLKAVLDTNYMVDLFKNLREQVSTRTFTHINLSQYLVKITYLQESIKAASQIIGDRINESVQMRKALMEALPVNSRKATVYYMSAKGTEEYIDITHPRDRLSPSVDSTHTTPFLFGISLPTGFDNRLVDPSFIFCDWLWVIPMDRITRIVCAKETIWKKS